MSSETLSARPRSLSVVVPVHNCAGALWRCLDALTRNSLPRETWELIVVDDASEDDTALVAAQFADVVVRLPERPQGANYARNRGADMSRGELLVFVSADVCVRPETLRGFMSVFADARIGAVSGAYEYSNDRRALTEYVACYNDFVRSRAAGDIDAFFPGLGAVRRSVLRRAGGFDEWSRDRPRVAALEMGHRIRAVGYRVLLNREIRATHLERRSYREMLQQTLRDHGVPYDDHQAPSAEMANAGLRWVRQREWQGPLLAWIAVDCFILGLIRGRHVLLWSMSLLALLAMLTLSYAFFSFAVRQRGAWCLVRLAPLHFAGALLVGTARLIDRVLRGIIGEPRPHPTIEALVEVGHKTWPPVPIRRTPAVSDSSNA